MNSIQWFRKLSLSSLYLWLFLFAFLPVLLIFFISFLTPTLHTPYDLPLTLENYHNFFDPLYVPILTQSLLLAGITTGVCLLLGYPFAYLISLMPKPTRTILMLLVIIPLWTSSLIRTYAMVGILKTHGPVSQLLLALGLREVPLQILYTNTATIIGMVYALFPFMVLPIFSTLEKMNRNLVFAAQDLGASTLLIFLKIIFPLSLPGVIAGSLFVFLPAMTLFYIPDILGGAKTIQLGNLIQTQFLSAQNWPMGATFSMMLVFFMLIIFIFYLRSRTKEALQVNL